MIITHHREKLINAVVYFARNTDYCGKTKLMKLLYLLDFCHFKQTGRSVTGLDYYAWKRGPVPKDLFYELDSMKPDLKASINVVPSESFERIVAKKGFDGKVFTPREKRLLEQISFVFKEARAEDMVEVTHLANEPWDKTMKEKGEGEKIEYLLSIDGKDGSLPYEEAKERMEEISEMYREYGTM